MNLFRSLLFFSVGLCCCLAASAQADVAARLEQQLTTAATDSLRARICLDLHDAWFKISQEKSRAYAVSALQYAQNVHIPVLQFLAYTALARCERKKRDYPAVYPYDSLSMLAALQSGNRDAIFNAQLMYAHDYLDDNKSGQAYPWLQKAEITAGLTGKTDQQAKIYHALAYYFRETNRHKQAIPYFRKAITAFEASGNSYKAAEARVFLAESLLAIGQTDSTAGLLFDAMEIYKKNNNIPGLAYANQVLGNIFLTTGDADKGIYYYGEAQQLFRQSNNKVEMALTIPDIARALLFKKDYQGALAHLQEADSTFTSMHYSYGRIKVYTLYGQYYSEKGQPVPAEENFRKADSMLRLESLPDLQTENEKYWARHKYHYRNYKAGDSLTYEYAQRIAGSKEPEAIARELNLIRSKNRNLDSNSLKILALLYRPGGVKVLRDLLKEKSLSQILPMDSLQALNPFSQATGAYDSSMAASFSRQVLDLEAHYKTKQVRDSLQIERQGSLIARQAAAQQSARLISVGVIAAILGLGLWLQYRSRRRAERDKAEIQLLQKEIHHRVRNNLGVVNRFVEIAERNRSDAFSLTSLKTRIAAMELLHRHLYQKDHIGLISVQDYFSELVEQIRECFPTGSEVRFELDAAVMLESKVAEKLGLIVNELVTNSLKYAFAEGQAGIIRIGIQESARDTRLLTVSDDGSGSAPPKTKKGYGSKLIAGLGHELNADMTYTYEKGTRFQMRFVLPDRN